MTRGAVKEQAGFTLLEMIIALTVMSLVITVLYAAFSTGITIWTDQDERSSDFERLTVTTRLVAQDLDTIRPYEFNWEEGKGKFFAAGKRTLFYATTNGLGSRDRAGGGLFFACMYLAPVQDGAPVGEALKEDEQGALFMCKMDRPWTGLLRDLAEFTALGETGREDFIPSEEVREKSVLLAGGISEAAFTFSGEAKLQGGEDLESLEEEGYALPDEEWAGDDPPAMIQFQARTQAGDLRVLGGHLARLAQAPASAAKVPVANATNSSGGVE